MVFPRYYFPADPVKLLGSVQYMAMVALGIIQCVQRAYFYKFPFTNSNFLAADISYFVGLPVWLKSQAALWGLLYWLISSASFSVAAYVLVWIICLGGSKRYMTYILCIPVGLFAMVPHGFRFIWFGISLLQATQGQSNLIYMRNPATPTITTNINPDFRIAFILDGITLVLGIALVLSSIVTYELTRRVMDGERKRGAVPTHQQDENGNYTSKCDCSCFLPSFYAPADSVSTNMFVIYALAIITTVAWGVQEVYNWKIIWTNPYILYTDIGYYMQSGFGLELAPQMVYGGFYWLFFYSTSFTIYILGVVPFVCIAGHKRLFTYPVTLFMIIVGGAASLARVGFWGWVWIDFTGWAWAMDPTNPTLRNLDFLAIFYSEIVILLCALFNFLSMQSLQYPTEALVVDERDSGVIQADGRANIGTGGENLIPV